MGAKRIIISGKGEPFLDENLFALIDFIRNEKLESAVTTNGSLLTAAIARDFFKSQVRVYMKLDSLEPSTQDYLARKKNAYTLCSYRIGGSTYVIPEGLKYLFEAGYGGETKRGRQFYLMLETVITQRNISDIPDLVRFVTACNILVYIEKMMPPHDCSSFDRVLIPSEGDEEALYRTVYPLMNKYSRDIFTKRCGFETNPFIDLNGNSRFCFSLDASVGNIRNESLLDLHRKQMANKNSVGKKSAAFDFFHKGFRNCRARRYAFQKGIWPLGGE